MMQTIQVKEALLEKLEHNIKKERTDWEMTMSKEKALIDAQKKEAESEIENKRLRYDSEHQMMSSELASKAEQLEKLRSELLNLQQELDIKKEEFEKCKKDEISRLEARQRLIEEKEISFHEQESELTDIRCLLAEAQSEKNEAVQNLQKVLKESDDIRKENAKMKLNIDEMGIIIQTSKLEHENFNNLKSANAELEGRFALSLRDYQLLSEKYERLQTERNELRESLRLFEEKDRECVTLRAENEEHLKRVNELVSEVKSFERRDRDISRREQELETEREAFLDRLRSVQESEIKLASIEDREHRLAKQKQLLEEEMNHHSDDVNRYAALKKDLCIKQESIARDMSMIESEKKLLQQKTEKVNILEDQLNAKMSNVAVSEKKLKEYAHLMKRQSKEIKAKEKDLQKVAKLLNEKRSNDSSLVSELQLLLDEEQRRYKELADRYERILVDYDENAEERMQQMALKIKEKDEELSRKQQILEDKLVKCEECETRLAAWQKELEKIAEALKNE